MEVIMSLKTCTGCGWLITESARGCPLCGAYHRNSGRKGCALLLFIFLALGLTVMCSQGHTFFLDNGDGTITDTNTGLMWEKGDSGPYVYWDRADAYARELRTGGYDDWRLPTISELEKIIDYLVTLPSFADGASAHYTRSAEYAGLVIGRSGGSIVTYTGWLIDGLAIAVRDGSGPSLFSYSLPLKAGWNLVSVPLVSRLSTMPDVVLATIYDKVIVVWNYDDDGWKYFIPFRQSPLTDMLPGRGYWIKVTEPCTLTIQGTVP